MSSADRRWQLDDGISSLRRSIADAELEHAAGELETDELDRIVRRDSALLIDLEAELALLEPAEEPELLPIKTASESRNVWKRNLGIVLIVAAVVVALLAFTGVRLPGSTGTGGAVVNRTQRIADLTAQGEAAAASGDTGGALTLFSKVLELEPTNAEALAESGWLTYQSGVVGKLPAVKTAGAQLVYRSITIDPGAAAGHLYAAIIKSNDGASRSTVLAELTAFAAGHPEKWLINLAKPFLASYGVNLKT
ncbi:MAG: hypothetical protein WCL38_00350 [Actinomycetota bacterium]